MPHLSFSLIPKVGNVGILVKTTYNRNKLRMVARWINFNANLHLSGCFEFTSKGLTRLSHILSNISNTKMPTLPTLWITGKPNCCSTVVWTDTKLVVKLNTEIYLYLAKRINLFAAHSPIKSKNSWLANNYFTIRIFMCRLHMAPQPVSKIHKPRDNSVYHHVTYRSHHVRSAHTIGLNSIFAMVYPAGRALSVD